MSVYRIIQTYNLCLQSVLMIQTTKSNLSDINRVIPVLSTVTGTSNVNIKIECCLSAVHWDNEHSWSRFKIYKKRFMEFVT